MADGGEVIFKFKGDDSQLNNVISKVSKTGTKLLKGLAVGTTAVAARIRRNSNCKCKS